MRIGVDYYPEHWGREMVGQDAEPIQPFLQIPICRTEQKRGQKKGTGNSEQSDSVGVHSLTRQPLT